MSATAPVVLELCGSPCEVRFPGLCAACGQPHAEWLRIEKVFERTSSDGPTEYVTAAVQAPFCRSCADRHRAEAVRISWTKRMLLCLREPIIIAGFGAGSFVLILSRLFLRELLQLSLVGVAISGAVLAFFAWIARGSFQAAYDQSHRHAVIPQTAVTAAFDFSDDHAQMFEGERRNYRLANPSFAAAFRELNQDRVWNPRSPKARAAARKRRWVLGLGIAGLAAFAIWSWFQED